MCFRIYIIISCFLIIGKNTTGQTIFSNNEKYGIIDNESKKVAIPTEYDTIIARSKYEFFNEDYSHSFILKKRNKYYFALKKHWFTSIRKESKDGWRTYPYLESGDSTKWVLLNQEFDTLYRLKQTIAIPFRKDATIQDYDTYREDTCFQIYKSIHTVIYRKEGKYGLLTFDRTSRTFGSYVVGQLRYTKKFFSLDDIQIHPAKYDKIMSLPIGNSTDDDYLVTQKDNKYGMLGLGKNIEIKPQFDAVPVKLRLDRNINSTTYEHGYYCVKKNGLWGVIYLTKENIESYNVAIPFHYNDIKDIKSNLRNVNFCNQHFYDEEESKRMEYKREYVACIYNSSPDTLPVQLNFIIYDGETNSPTKWNSTNNKEELNKNYISPIEKHITFNPTINGKPLAQQKEYEYLFTSNIKNIIDSYAEKSGKPTAPLFFVLKMDRSEDVVNNDYNLYRRGETKKGDSYSARFIDPMLPRFDYIYRKPRAIAIYRFINDRFVPLSEFVDEDKNTTYEIVTELFTDYYANIETDPKNKAETYLSNLILKSTKLESGKYKHTFFTFEGTKVYETTSNHPIDYWKFVPRSPTIYYIPDRDFGLEFYTETTNRRGKTKKRKVCYYNVKTKQFYK